MGDTKIKINLREGTFEIEGSESFVEKYGDKILKAVETLPLVYTPVSSLPEDLTSFENQKPKKKNSKSRPKPSLELVPLDLTASQNKPSLMEFFESKKPESNQEIITLFAYYMKKYLSINNMKYGHALFCYNEIKKPKPTNVVQLFRDTSSLKKWVEVGDEQHTVKITIAGENLMEHKLPKGQKTD